MIHCNYPLHRLPIRLLALVLSVFALGGCGHSDSPGVPDTPNGGGDERIVCFATGGLHAVSRAPFAQGTPVKIFVYNDAANPADIFAVSPFKTVWGTMGDPADDLSEVVLSGGDIDADGLLVLRSGLAYHFIAVVDNTPGATVGDIAAPTAGAMQPIVHGRDLLAARQSETLAYSTTPATIRFTQNSANAGNIPHLGCAIAVEGVASAALLAQHPAVAVRVAGIDFYYCLPASAILAFSNVGAVDPLTIVADGWNTARVINYDSSMATLTTTTDKATSGDAVILPYPLRNPPATHNTLNIHFRFSVAGNDVKLEASNVGMPAFVSGYRYRFIVELETVNATTVDAILKLAIGPWNDTGWTGGIGGDPANDILIIELGNWQTQTITGGIGGDGNRDVSIFTTNPWYEKDWNAPIGRCQL